MHDQDSATALSAQSAPQSQHEEIVRGVYRGFLDREPDPAGLRHWMQSLADNGSTADLMHAIMQSDEYRRKAALATTQTQVKKLVTSRAKSLFKNSPLRIVDIGAQELEGEEHIYAPIGQYELDHQVIGFEPLEEKLHERKQLDSHNRIKLYPNFIGDGKQHLFHINNFDATSSLLPLNQALNQHLLHLSNLRTEKTEQVDTQQLDHVLSDAERVDFLKLDIQGFELPALQHASAVLARTNVVHCEVSFAEIYEGQAFFSEIESLLRQQGFYFVDFSSSCRYSYHCGSKNISKDRLGWADAVFFKRSELLHSAHDLLAQCMIAMLVYDKFSLSEFLAERHDALSDFRLAPLFGGDQ